MSRSGQRWLLFIATFLVLVLISIHGWNSSAAMGDPILLDPIFGSSSVSQPLPGQELQGVDIVEQPDGKTILLLSDPFNPLSDFTLVRLLENGSIDTTFGDNGIATADYNGQGDDGMRLLRLKDGSIIVGGVSRATNQLPWELVFTRFLPNGTQDTIFGEDGWLRLDDGSYLNDLAQQPDGKIVAVGRLFRAPEYTDAILLRFDMEGMLDPTFGNDGISVEIGRSYGAVYVLPDGKILIGGTSNTVLPEPSDAIVRRLLPNGAIDTTFGTSGDAILSIGGPDHYENILDLMLDAEGRIVFTGVDCQLPDPNSGCITTIITGRVLPHGVPDGTYNAWGIKLIPHWIDGFLYGDGGLRLTVLEDGTWLVFSGYGYVVHLDAAGNPIPTFGQEGWYNTSNLFGIYNSPAGGIRAANGTLYIAGTDGDSGYVHRITAEGRPDSTFGETGYTMLPGWDDITRAWTLDAGGNLLLMGDYSLFRYTPNGQLDPTFDNDGVYIFPTFNSGFSHIATDTAQRLVLAGGDENTVQIARRLPNGQPDSTFGTNGSTALAFQYPTRPLAVGALPNGKIIVVIELTRDSTHLEFQVAQLNPNGTLDTDYGTEGYAIYPDCPKEVTYTPEPYTVIEANGRVTIASLCYIANWGLTAVRWDANGFLDETFGNFGVVRNNTVQYLDGLQYQTDGKLLFFSATYAISPPDLLKVLRYSAVGQPDPTFGTDGMVLINPPLQFGYPQIKGMYEQPDGKLLFLASQETYPVPEKAWFRLLSDGSSDPGFANGGLAPFSIPARDGDVRGFLATSDRRLLTIGMFGFRLPDYGNPSPLIARWLISDVPPLPTATPTMTLTPTNTPSPTSTHTPSATTTASHTPTATASVTPTPTLPTATATATSSSTSSATPSAIPTIPTIVPPTPTGTPSITESILYLPLIRH